MVMNDYFTKINIFSISIPSNMVYTYKGIKY